MIIQTILALSLFGSACSAEQAIKTDNNVKQIALQKNKHLDIHTLYSKMKNEMENERYEYYQKRHLQRSLQLCGQAPPLRHPPTANSSETIINIQKGKESMEKTILKRKNLMAKLFKLNPEISKERKEGIIEGFEKYKKSVINEHNRSRAYQMARSPTKEEWKNYFWKQKSRFASLFLTRYLPKQDQERERLKKRGHKEDKILNNHRLLVVTKDIYGVACMYCHNKKDGLNKSSVVDNHIAASHINNVFDDIEPMVIELKPWGDIHSDEYRALILAYENL